MPISLAPIFNQPARAGFTLLELMIVMGIVAAMVALALPRLGGQNHQMRQAVRKLSSITKELQSTAKLQGAIYRLVIDLGEGRKEDPQRYWVEKATSKTVLTRAEMEAAEEDPRQRPGAADEETPQLFAEDNRLLKGKGELPGGLRFADVELNRSENAATSGKVYIHFFPQGLADEAVIHLDGGEKLRWSLAIHPLTGKTDIIPERVTLKEISGR